MDYITFPTKTPQNVNNSIEFSTKFTIYFRKNKKHQIAFN